MDSLGKARRSALTTVSPPMPESKTPIGRASPPEMFLGFSTTDRDRRRLLFVFRSRRLPRLQRIGDRSRVRRQTLSDDSESPVAARAVIDRGVVALHTL